MVEQTSPDILLLDIGMPVPDGFAPMMMEVDFIPRRFAEDVRRIQETSSLNPKHGVILWLLTLGRLWRLRCTPSILESANRRSFWHLFLSCYCRAHSRLSFIIGEGVETQA